MKVKNGFVLRNIMDEYLLMPAGEFRESFHSVILLNEVSSFIYRKLLNPVSREELLKAILEEYDVDPAQAAEDMDEFLEELKKRELLE